VQSVRGESHVKVAADATSVTGADATDPHACRVFRVSCNGAQQLREHQAGTAHLLRVEEPMRRAAAPPGSPPPGIGERAQARAHAKGDAPSPPAQTELPPAPRSGPTSGQSSFALEAAGAAGKASGPSPKLSPTTSPVRQASRPGGKASIPVGKANSPTGKASSPMGKAREDGEISATSPPSHVPPPGAPRPGCQLPLCGAGSDLHVDGGHAAAEVAPTVRPGGAHSARSLLQALLPMREPAGTAIATAGHSCGDPAGAAPVSTPSVAPATAPGPAFAPPRWSGAAGSKLDKADSTKPGVERAAAAAPPPKPPIVSVPAGGYFPMTAEMRRRLLPYGPESGHSVPARSGLVLPGGPATAAATAAAAAAAAAAAVEREPAGAGPAKFLPLSWAVPHAAAKPTSSGGQVAPDASRRDGPRPRPLRAPVT
jgi:hypothetical protein